MIQEFLPQMRVCRADDQVVNIMPLNHSVPIIILAYVDAGVGQQLSKVVHPLYLPLYHLHSPIATASFFLNSIRLGVASFLEFQDRIR